MKLLRNILAMLPVFVAVISGSSFAETAGTEPTVTGRPVVGLALSGGCVKGFAHIGVLKVLEEEGVDVDVVTGTSMGAIIGGLYAIGYTAAEIETLVVTTDWNKYMDDSPERRDLTMELKQYNDRYQISLPFGKTGVELPTGYLSGQRFGNVLNRMTWHVHDDTVFTLFPRKFACIATDICEGKVVVLKKGFLPEAMRASFAIPGVFTAVKFDDKLLVDGSIARNFPVQDARELGATYVVGVDVGGTQIDPKQLTSVIDVIAQSFNYNDATSSQKQRSLCDLLIEPDISDIASFDFDKSKIAIQRGIDAARKALPQIKKIARLQKQHPKPKRTFYQPTETVVVNAIKINGLDRTTAVLVTTRLGFKTPAVLTANDLEKTINNIYSTGFYERVYYRLHGNDTGNTMEIFVVEKEGDQLRFGFHYDSDQKAAAILNATLRNLYYRGTLTTVDVILGNEEQYLFSHSVTTNQKPRIGLRFYFDHQRSDALLYNSAIGTSSQRLRKTKAGLFIGSVYSTAFVAGCGVAWNYHTSSDLTSDSSFAPTITEFFYTWYASLQYETLDRVNFPTSGIQFSGVGQLAERRFGSRRNFRTLNVNGAGYLPIMKTWTVSSGFEFANNVGNELPTNSKIMFGGIDDFLGYDFRALSGNGKQIIRAGVQWEPWTRKFLLARANIGNVFDEWKWRFDRNQYLTGWGITAGWLTVAGPLQFTTHVSPSNQVLYNFRFGYMF